MRKNSRIFNDVEMDKYIDEFGRELEEIIEMAMEKINKRIDETIAFLEAHPIK